MAAFRLLSERYPKVGTDLCRLFICDEKVINIRLRRRLFSERSNPASYCVDLVRRCDNENFVCTLLLPNHIRTAAMAFRAFNIEVAQVQDMVSNETIGQMRMQFWIDTVDKIFKNDPPHHPVARELNRVLRSKKLSKFWFLRLIESRESRLSNRPFLDVTEIEKYSEDSISSIYYLILEYCGVKNVDVDHLASHVGKAAGTSNVLRGFVHNLKQRNVNLPLDVLLKHSISQEEILKCEKADRLKDVVYDVACVAKQHVKLAYSFKDRIPKETRKIFLPLTGVNSYLDRLEQMNFDICHPSLAVRPLSLLPKLWWNARRNTF